MAFQRLIRAATLAAFACSMVACGSGEAAQRQAFIAFLQQRIVDKPGVHVPQVPAEEQKTWGEYAKHYAVITDFNNGLSEQVSKPMQAVVARGAVNSLQALGERRGDVAAARQGLAELQQALARQLASADKSRAALQQPADLKVVYDAAYERDVAGPARAMKEIFPVGLASMDAALELADFIKTNSSKVRINGSTVEVNDPHLRAELATRLKAMNTHGQAVMAAQQRMRTMMYGS